MNVTRAKIVRFSGPEELAESAAKDWIGALGRQGRGRTTVALPGGRIYARFFQALGKLGADNPGVFKDVEFFWGDERCVPPTDQESNFRLANEAFLGPVGIDPTRIHRIHGEEKPSVAAERAEQEFRKFFPGEEKKTVLDYVFLGMGEDGHVASLFPGDTAEQMASPHIYRPVVGPKPPPHRITLGYDTICAAKEVWVLISGKEKAGALRQSLNSRATPLGRVLSRRTQSLILTDCEI